MTLNLCAYSKVDELFLEHNNRPMKALWEALQDTANQGIELPMAIIMDPRCGIERKVEESDKLLHTVGATPVILAINVAGRFDVAKALLAAGADVNAKDANGRNSLMAAACKGKLVAIESLISYGADINAVDKNGKTALHYAASLGHASIVELLERSGPNLEVVDDEGWTPLHFAASYGHVGTIKTLLQLGANQAAVSNGGRTPLHCAAADLFVRLEAIEAFRCNGAAFEANLTAVDKNGHTPLQVYGPSAFSIMGTDSIIPLLTPILTPQFAEIDRRSGLRQLDAAAAELQQALA